MLRNRFSAGILSMLLMWCHGLQAAEPPSINLSQAELNETEGIIISGDKLELHLDRKMRSIGNASIRRGNQDIFGDTIEYDFQNDELHATGNARIELGDAKLTGPELRMRLSENIGEMRDASISLKKRSAPVGSMGASSTGTLTRQLGHLPPSQQTGNNSALAIANYHDAISDDASQTTNARGDAKAIFFEGQDKKRLTGARYTTCAPNVDDWYIKASEIEINDYTDSGTAKNAYIEFKGMPLLYTPWMNFSFSTQRKSGLLAPTIGSTSRSGFEVLTPFYWNISPNMDATLAARALSKRGVQLQGEFRYLDESFNGIDNVEYLPGDSLAHADRYYANLKHQHQLGKGWSAGYNLEKVSDNQYFSELSTRITTTSRINLPQQFNVNYGNENWQFNALAQKFQTLDGVSYPYERLPQLTLNGNQYYGDLNVNLYTQMVTFDTSNNAPTRPTGTRFTAYPSISVPFKTPYGYATGKLGLHHTRYSLNHVDNDLESQQRTLPIFSLDSGIYLDREFDIANRAYTQTLEPRLFYVYIPNKNQSDIPIFDSGKSDLNFGSLFNENQFTGNDRINNANQLSFALTTRFIEGSTGIQRLSASIGQRYHYADQKVAIDYNNPDAFRKQNSSDIIASLTTYLKSTWNIDAFWQYNTDDSSAVRTTLSSRYNPEPGKTLNLSYSYRRDLIDQFDISGQWPLGRGWYGIGRTNYSMRENRIIEALAGLEYDAGCWQARSVLQRVSTATADANYALFFQLELGGLASIGANPLAVIKRNIPGYVGSGLIPDTYQQPYYE